MRKIDSIILHCADTPEGKDFTVEDIDRWHKQRGWSGIGYHFVVYRDGTVEKGRDIDTAGAHCEGHNKTSIGICYIGGKGKNGEPKDTRTPQQHDSLVDLVLILQHQYNIPTINIHCHNEFSTKPCPCFSIEDFIKELVSE